MTREEYLEIRETNSLNLKDLYDTLLLNPTFKVESYSMFVEYYNILSSRMMFDLNGILIKEFKRLNDIRFNVTSLHDKNGKEINFY